MKKKLNILFLSSWYPSKVNKSNGDFVQRHAEAIATKHNVTVIYIVTDPQLRKKKKIDSFQKDGVKTTIIYIKSYPTPIKYFIFIYTYLAQIKKVEAVDLIHINVTYPVGIIGLYLKKLNNIPYIITEHSTKYQSLRGGKISFLKKILIKSILKNACFICPVSQNLCNSFIRLGFNGNFYPIPNVVNTTQFYPNEKENKEFTITHISYMNNEHKNITGILNVLKKIQNKGFHFHFNLIGENSVKYLPLIEVLGIKNTSIINQISHHKVAEYLRNSNLFILFSNYENLPCVILEAFSCGIPVVSTNVGGIKEHFPPNFGYLININDEKELEKAILKVYKSKLKIDKLNMYNYAKDNFGINQICNKYSYIYYKTLEN